MKEEATKARRQYMRDYQRKYRKTEQGKAAIIRYWAKKAKEMGISEEAQETETPKIPNLFKKYYEWYQSGRIDISELALLSEVPEQVCYDYIDFLQSEDTTEPEDLSESDKEIALQWNRRYTADYRKANPEKVQQWRKNAIVNAYKKLIAAEPQYKIKEND